MSERLAPTQLGGEPRVNLLPPEVLERAKARSRRRGLAALVVGVAVVAGAGYAAASLYATNAHAQLESSQARTQQLLTERIEYSEATSVATLVAATTEARGVGTSTEIVWADIVDDIRLLLPADTGIAAVTFTGRAPWEPALLPGGALRSPRVATTTIVLASAAIPPAAEWSRRLATIPGFADATPFTVDYDVATGAYLTTIVLNLNPEVLSGRFLPDGTAAAE